jgi:hypothetical protein
MPSLGHQYDGFKVGQVWQCRHKAITLSLSEFSLTLAQSRFAPPMFDAEQYDGSHLGRCHSLGAVKVADYFAMSVHN